VRALLLAIAMMIVAGLIPGGPLVLLPELDPYADTLPPPPVAPADRQGSARVTVRTMEGAPLAGAVVRAVFVKDGKAYLAARVYSQADGVASIAALPIGAHWFLVDARGRARASAQRTVATEPVQIELRLGPERPLRVEVRDDLGKPLAGAELEIRGADPLPKGARTDAAGVAQPSGLGAGPLRLIARLPGYDEASVTLAAKDGRATIVLHRLGALVVTVLDPQGNKAIGATVAIAGGNLAVPRTTTTGADGTARIAGLSVGAYDLRATKGQLVSPVEIGVPLRRGVDGAITLKLELGRELRVHVVDEDGRAVKDADVVVLEGGISPFLIEGKTDARGDLRLGPIAASQAAIGARAEGFVPRGPIAVPAVADPAKQEPIELTIRRAATLIGEVVDGRGAPIDGATIEVVGTDLDGQPIDATPATMGFQKALLARAQRPSPTLIPIGELGVVPGPVPPIPRAGAKTNGAPEQGSPFEPWVTRNDGTFRAAPVPPGTLRALVRHPAYVEGISGPVRVAPGGEGKVRVVLAAGGRIAGVVKDEKGYPVEGILVEVAARHGSLARNARTERDGTFAIPALPGEVTVTLSLADHPSEPVLRTDVEVPEGGTKQLELTLPAPRGDLKVHVVDDRRYPLKGAQITLASLDPKAPLKTTAFSDDRGDATLARVVGVRAQIEVRMPGFAASRSVQEATPATLEIELAPGITVRGTIYAPGGRTSLVGATVSLLGEGAVRRAISDKDGRFSFGDVPAGAATIEVRAAGTAGLRKAVAIANTGSRAETDLGRLELLAAGSVEGEVVDESGRPVAGARVARDRVPTYVPAAGAGAAVATTDSTGSFKLAEVAVGEAEIEAYAADVGRGRSDKIRIDEGRATTRVRIVLRPGSGTGTEDLSPGGVAITLSESEGRVFVAAVAPASEAERAGLVEQDEILSIDGVAVTTAADARARLGGPLAVDVIVNVRRGNVDRSFRVAREATKK
jgi:hypothetical protein